MLSPEITRSEDIQPLCTPEWLDTLHPLDDQTERNIQETRDAVISILRGYDSRMIAVVGPCSMDDSRLADGTPSVLQFAERLDEIRKTPVVEDNLLTIMRIPPAKPRTDVGWAGLDETDPEESHWLMSEIAGMGMPVAMEIMDRDQLARYGGLLSLGWVGARNNKDTLLRRTLSAFPELPLFCKNDDHGDVDAAVLALETIATRQSNVRITMPDGTTGLLRQSRGNRNAGLLWRGGSDNPNPAGFSAGLNDTASRGMPYGVDCSHGSAQAFDPSGNYGKTVEGQLRSFDSLIDHIDSNSLPLQPVAVMIESHLHAGSDASGETAGMSRTDPCVSVEQLNSMMTRLALSTASQRAQTLEAVS